MLHKLSLIDLLEKASDHYDLGSKYDAEKRPNKAKKHYNSALKFYEKALKRYKKEGKENSPEHLEYLLDIVETQCMLLTYLSIESAFFKKNEQIFENIYKEFNKTQDLAKKIPKLDKIYKLRIKQLHIHIFHKEYIYRYNQSIEYFKTPLPKEDIFNHPTYLKEKTLAFKASKRIIELLSFPNDTPYRVNSFHQTGEGFLTDSQEKENFIKNFYDNWETNFLDQLAELEEKTTHIPTKIRILERIILETEKFLKFVEGLNVNIKKLPEIYLTLFNAYQDCHSLMSDGKEKTQLLKKFNEKLQNYLCKPGKKTYDKNYIELLSCQYYLLIQMQAPQEQILYAAKHFLEIYLPYTQEEINELPWLQEMKKYYEDFYARHLEAKKHTKNPPVLNNEPEQMALNFFRQKRKALSPTSNSWAFISRLDSFRILKPSLTYLVQLKADEIEKNCEGDQILGNMCYALIRITKKLLLKEENTNNILFDWHTINLYKFCETLNVAQTEELREKINSFCDSYKDLLNSNFFKEASNNWKGLYTLESFLLPVKINNFLNIYFKNIENFFPKNSNFKTNILQELLLEMNEWNQQSLSRYQLPLV